MEKQNLSLYNKINKMRLELSKNMQKSGKNTYSNYDYFQLKDFMPDVIKLCNENKVFTKFWIEKTAIHTSVIQNKENNNFVEELFDTIEYAYLQVIDTETGEETTFKKETADCKLQAAQPIQNLGSKSTYMKRYMYMDLFEINENDKVEEETGKPVKVETVEEPKKTKATVKSVSTKAEVKEEPKVETKVEEAVNTDELMSMETKMELANLIKEKGLDPRNTILEIASDLGVDVPNLKENQKDEIIKRINERN